MAARITTGQTLGLRALASGGRTAIGSYDQIERYLRRTLGPEHAALFAEPSVRGAEIDWFTNFDSADRPVRLNETDPNARSAIANLERLVSDIEGCAVTLQKSDRPDERILGDMLARALEIPNEEAIFRVGDQPVLTFWGHVVDEGTTPENPIRSVIRRARNTDNNNTLDSERPVANDGLEIETYEDTGRVQGKHSIYGIPSKYVPITILSWVVFTVLLIAIGMELLRGCAIGLPHAWTGWLINFCPDGAEVGDPAALQAEHDKQQLLQAQYEQLVRQADLARQTCQITGLTTPMPREQPESHQDQSPQQKTPEQPIAHPDVDNKSPESPMKFPDKLSSIEGCWKAHEGLTAVQDNVDTNRKLDVTYCFNADGSGSQTIRYLDTGSTCRGSAHAQLEGDKLIIVGETVPCEGDGGFEAVSSVCRRGENGEARCDETPQGDRKPSFQDFPFTHVESK